MSTEEIAREWRTEVLSKYPWHPSKSQAGALAKGEAGGFMVHCDYLGRQAYLKPRRRDGARGHERAAREKIASDLAFDLGVTVPPVLLYRRDGAGSDEVNVCVSLRMFRAQFSWSQVCDFLDRPESETRALLSARLSEAASKGLVFDTWVGQGDHNDHPHNILFGYDTNDYKSLNSFIFLDYAMALGYGGLWWDGRFAEVAEIGFPPKMLDVLDRSIVDQTVDAIERYSDDVIAEIVGRVPTSHLPAEEGAVITDGLRARRSLVRGAVFARIQ